MIRGLQKRGVETSIVTLRVNRDYARMLHDSGVTVLAEREVEGSVGFTPIALTRLPWAALRLGRLARSIRSADWKLVLSDDSIPCAKELSEEQIAYLSQGAFPMLFFSPDFVRVGGVVKRLLSADACGTIRANGRHLSRYRLLLANSASCKTLMSFVYGVPFSRVIYPPIDPIFFNTHDTVERGNYALAMVRSGSESEIGLLGRLAKQLPLKVVGGARIPGAESLGVISDEQLAYLYGHAKFLCFPQTRDYFGYAIAEAMACGTPSLAFDCLGPAEQIMNGVNGWLARTQSEFVQLALELARSEVAEGMSKECRSRAQTYSCDHSSGELIAAFQQV